MQKISYFHLFIFNIQWILETPEQTGQTQLLIFVNLYQYAKYQFTMSIHFTDTVNFRIQRLAKPISEHAHTQNF